ARAELGRIGPDRRESDLAELLWIIDAGQLREELLSVLDGVRVTAGLRPPMRFRDRGGRDLLAVDRELVDTACRSDCPAVLEREEVEDGPVLGMLPNPIPGVAYREERVLERSLEIGEDGHTGAPELLGELRDVALVDPERAQHQRRCGYGDYAERCFLLHREDRVTHSRIDDYPPPVAEL